MQQHTDEQLVKMVLSGQTAAFELLVQRYQKQIFALAYRLGGDYDEAQDMAQEAFVRIYQELSRFDTGRRFFPWMYRVAHNTCVNILHKRPKDTSSLEDALPFWEDDNSSSSPTEAFALQERAEKVQSALQSLPENYRLPLVLKYLEGMSYQEISDQLSLPVSTIETRLFRGRNMLKKLLQPYIKS